MRIVDKRDKDYYDGVQRNGQDLTCVYIRKSKNIEIPKFDGGFAGRAKGFYIGFCGEIYPVLHIEPKRHSELEQQFEFGRGHVYYPNTDDFYYSADEKCFDAYKKAWGDYRRTKWTGIKYVEIDADKDIKDFFAHKPDSLNGLFRDHSVPIFVTENCRGSKGWDSDADVELNPLLKYYGFQRVVDPFSCFQRIHGFMSGVLGPEQKPIPEIDDLTKIDLHGMDKFSFRSDKGTRPKRKKK